METDEEQYLPQDATASVLRALRLTQAEQLKALSMLQKDPGATLKEVKEFTEKRHADFTMWVRTFVQTEKDYKASQQQYGARTHAGGALGNELKDKPKKNNKKRQLHHCFFSGRTVACGNRTYPLAPRALRTFYLALKAQQGSLEPVMR